MDKILNEEELIKIVIEITNEPHLMTAVEKLKAFLLNQGEGSERSVATDAQ